MIGIAKKAQAMQLIAASLCLFEVIHGDTADWG